MSLIVCIILTAAVRWNSEVFIVIIIGITTFASGMHDECGIYRYSLLVIVYMVV